MSQFINRMLFTLWLIKIEKKNVLNFKKSKQRHLLGLWAETPLLKRDDVHLMISILYIAKFKRDRKLAYYRKLNYSRRLKYQYNKESSGLQRLIFYQLIPFSILFKCYLTRRGYSKLTRTVSWKSSHCELSRGFFLYVSFFMFER